LLGTRYGAEGPESVNIETWRTNGNKSSFSMNPRVPPNEPLKQKAAPRRELGRLPLAGGEVPRARSYLPGSSAFPDAAAAERRYVGREAKRAAGS
jgi:hypothetical protein